MKSTGICLLLSIFAASGCSVAIAEASGQSLHFTMERYPGYFGEYCLDMQDGDILELAVDSPYPVRLNLHYHDESDDEARFLLDKLIDDASLSTVSVPADGKYCLQVTNFEARQSRFELLLKYAVQPTARVTSD